MTKREIRTQYSGFILFAAKLLTVATGIAFSVLIVARNLTENEFGVYGKLNSIIIPYFTLLSSAIPFWVMRFVARNKEGAAKTGILVNMILAVLTTLVYAGLLPLIIPAFKLQDYALVCSIVVLQIIEIYLIAALEACIQAQQPHFIGYGLLFSEICKAVLAYIFIIELQLSLLGVFLSILTAFAIRITFYFKIIWRELKNKIVLSYAKEWIKGAAFNVYNILGDRVAAVILVMLAIYGEPIEIGAASAVSAAGYYQAAIIIANIITYSSFLAFALYPKILAENKLEEATASLKTVLMFAVPMTAGVIAMPDSYLIILKEGAYVPAEPVLIILAADALILTISSIFTSILFGIERLDEKAQIRFKKFVKSRLFIILSLPYAHSLITLPTAYYVLTNFAVNQPLLVAIYATAINTMAHLAMFVVAYIIVRKAVAVIIPWKSIAKYVFASAVMATFLLLIPHPTKLSLTLGVTALGGIMYLTLLLGIDEETRKLASAILKEIKNRFK